MHFYSLFCLPPYGNVVFSRSKLHAHRKSLVFFCSRLLPAVGNLMFCVFFPVRAEAQGSLCVVKLLAFSRALNLRARRIFLYAFLHGFLNMR